MAEFRGAIRGPDSSLERRLMFLYTRLQQCLLWGTVTQLQIAF